MDSSAPRPGNTVSALFTWIVFFAALALLLIFPFDQLGLPRAISTVQRYLLGALGQLLPYVGVAGFGILVGMSEITSAFSDYPREALGTQWGKYLIGLNVGAAVIALVAARVYAPEMDMLLLTLTVGAGFPTLIRTKFTLAKKFGGGEDLSVNVGWLYEQFQQLCKKQIDLELMTFRRTLVDGLLQRYPSVKELYDTALYVINARATLTKDEETARLEDLKKTIDQKVPPELARLNLGLMILELGGVSYVESLIQVRQNVVPGSTAAAGGAELTPETVVKKLCELPLSELTQRALAALASPEDQQRVAGLAEPVPGIPEVTRRASIAQFAVDHLGVEAAQKLAEGKPLDTPHM